MAIIDQLSGDRRSQLCIPDIQDGTGPTFETMDDFTESDIHALVDGGSLEDSQDLFDGRYGGRGLGGSFYAPPSRPPVSLGEENAGLPFYPAYGGSTTYSESGPGDGRY
jgi:hypothetical protein